MEALRIRVWDIAGLNFSPPGTVQDADVQLNLEPHATSVPLWCQIFQDCILGVAEIRCHPPPGSDLVDFSYMLLREGVSTKVAVRYELKIERTEPERYNLSLMHIATGYLPTRIHSPGGEHSTGMAYELTRIPLDLGGEYSADMNLDRARRPFDGHGARAFLYEPIGKPLPCSDRSNIVLSEQRPPARLVPLLPGFPISSWAFSGRVFHQVEV
jgi:hypothetical protein